MLSHSQSYDDSMNHSSDPFRYVMWRVLYYYTLTNIENSFETSSSPFAEDGDYAHSSFTSATYGSDVASMNILQQLSQHSHTPPMSPADDPRPNSAGSVNRSSAPAQPSPLKDSLTPSRSSVQSNQCSTPPTSPLDSKDNLDDLFGNIQDNSSYSQFDLEMKAMGDFTSLDSSSYDLLDFSV
jgi:regulatory protein SWI5